MNIVKVEDVKRPLKKGEIYLVPCITSVEYIDTDEDVLLLDLDHTKKYKKIIHITPVINLPHSDKENGQSETHYHADYRFLKHDNVGVTPTIKNTHSTYVFCKNSRPEKNINTKLEYIELPVINENFSGITPVIFISKSKIKHKCIHNGKCPHRGYDLSQVNNIDGKITCPLHGLEFDANTGKLLNR